MKVNHTRSERKPSVVAIIAILLGAVVVGAALGLLVFYLVKPGPPAQMASSLPVKPKLRYTTETITLMGGTPFETPAYLLSSTSKAKGSTVLVLGGVHGDEPAGYTSAGKLVAAKVSQGTLIVIPRSNQVAIKKGTREGTTDLNRCFPGDINGTNENKLAAEIFGVARDKGANLDLNLHGATGFYLQDPAHWGQTIIFDFPESRAFPDRVVAEVNQGITVPYEKFSVLIYPIEKCMSYVTYQLLHIPAYGIEVPSIMGLSQGVYYHLRVVQQFCEDAGLKVDNWNEILAP